MTSSQRTVEAYLRWGLRLISWSGTGKGPQGSEAVRWNQRSDTEFIPDRQWGAFNGHEVHPGRYLVDIDVDAAKARPFARYLFPATNFAFGRKSKSLSHLFYTCSKPIRSFKLVDPIDNETIIELRCANDDGESVTQTMLPPSTRFPRNDKGENGEPEPLAFLREPNWDATLEECYELGPNAVIGHTEDPEFLPRVVYYAGIGYVLAKHLGVNGFGHEPRLCYAGFLLRAGITEMDAIAIGTGIGELCNNTEQHDVRTAVESTAKRLKAGDRKVKGGSQLAAMLGDPGKRIIATVATWLGKDGDFARNADGNILPNHQGNVRRAFSTLDWKFTLNEFSGTLFGQNGTGGPQQISDRVTETLWLKIDAELRFRPTFDFFEKVVRVTASESPFHPVRDYLAGLTWDGTPRIDDWLTRYCAAEDKEFIHVVGALTLIAAVRRVRVPGCKFDTMLIMESEEQGVGKSTAWKIMSVNPDWFSDDLPLNIGAKETIERTSGKWIIEASELTKMRDTQAEQLKGFLSRDTDGPVRLAYERHAVSRQRHFVIVGTTNNLQYLTDPTGGRRFWPVRTPKVELNLLARDRDQLWAEAAHREANGESITLPERMWAAASKEQADRAIEDGWADVLEEALAFVTEGQPVAVSRVFDLIGMNTERRDAAASRRIAAVMQSLGFRRGTYRIDGRVCKGWAKPNTRPRLPGTEITEIP